jgi:hypothetical protein
VSESQRSTDGGDDAFERTVHGKLLEVGMGDAICSTRIGPAEAVTKKLKKGFRPLKSPHDGTGNTIHVYKYLSSN